jgi:cysteine desulfurase
MASRRIYLDYAATTPLDPRVFEAMRPYFSEQFGNPSSVHRWGQEAEAALEDSRAKVAAALGCKPSEVLFTACGTESDNLALRGVARAQKSSRGANHILTTPVEHPAVLRTAESLAQDEGFEVEYLRVDAYGRAEAEDLARKLRPDTAIVSVIYANNEIGTINPIAELAALCRSKEVPFHTDAVQAASQLPVDVGQLGVDLMSIGAHKFYGPKGVGALYFREGIRTQPLQTGGGQEFGLRPGTHNVPLVVGLAAALEITVREREIHNTNFLRLRERLLAGIPPRIPETRPTGDPRDRLPNHASFVFHGLDGNQLLAALDLAGFACSSGSACKTGDPEPSEVLTALGLPREWALGSLRVTVGRGTTPENIEGLLSALPEIVGRLRTAREVAR